MNKWRLLKKYMSGCCTGVFGKSIPIEDVEPFLQEELGYTDKQPKIYLNYNHPIMDGLNEDEKDFFILGVFTHELLHQIYTNFSYFESQLMKIKDRREQKIFSEINNILEDPAIEFFAPNEIGGKLLKALNFMISYIYKKSPNIEESNSPLSQWLNALIQFGDMGIIKGSFTYPEAKKIYNQTVVLFNQGITEPNFEKRVEISKKITDISRPLWDIEEDSFFEQMKDFDESMEQTGKNMSEKGGDNKNTPSKPSETSKSKRQEKTIQDILDSLKKESEAKSESKEKNENGELSQKNDENKSSDDRESENSSDSSTSDADSTDVDSADTNSSEEKSNDSESSNKGSSDTESPNTETSDTESNSNPEKCDNSESKNENNEKSDLELDDEVEHNSDNVRNTEVNVNKNNGSIPNIKFSGQEEESEKEIDFSEYEITVDDLENLKKDLDKENEKEKNQSKNEDKQNSQSIENFKIHSDKWNRNAKCINYDVKSNKDLSELYDLELNLLSGYISKLKNSLLKIFKEDVEEKLYKSSGNINLKRMSSGTVSARIFDKKIGPYQKNDLAITLVIDESGSMGSDKSLAAKQTAIILAEVCSKLKIPVYVMGFTTGNGYDAVHYHYIHWNNNKTARQKLLNITGRNCNFDGYSIRYAGELLKKRKEKHKLLIVISDGTPSHSLSGNGIADTREAVKNVKKYASVLGISIKNSQKDILKTFYDNDFFHVDRLEDLIPRFIKRMKIIVSNWE